MGKPSGWARKPGLLLLIGMLAIVAIAGCSSVRPSRGNPAVSGSQAHASAKKTYQGTTGRLVSPADHNATDVHYVQQMAAYDQQVLAMAALPQVNSSGGTVSALASGAKDELPSVLARYRKWLTEWRRAALPTPSVAAVQRARGSSFDTAFVKLFLANQQAILSLANQEVQNGTFAPALADAAAEANAAGRLIGILQPQLSAS